VKAAQQSVGHPILNLSFEIYLVAASTTGAASSYEASASATQSNNTPAAYSPNPSSAFVSSGSPMHTPISGVAMTIVVCFIMM